MNNPKLNVLSLARLNENFSPSLIKVNYIYEDKNFINITVVRKSGKEEILKVDKTKNSFEIFEEPIDSKYYYMLRSEEPESDYSDNTVFKDVQSFMSVDKAMKELEKLSNKNNLVEYIVEVYFIDL